MYAVVENGGKQYKVQIGDIFNIEKINAEPGAVIELTPILIADGDKITTGNPVPNIKVTAEVVGAVKGEKVIVYRYKAKKNVRKKQGHRQKYTRIKITSIA